ncbi:tRNA splicing endonuclease 54 [Bulinus truncatus]|nr:tRNA splicing endonuclease 54 [Bulinus truncatus]
MSFYDLCKNSVLSANDLFKYRVKRDSTIPAKGGQKDYEPDGSWMQTKALEVFMQERSTILSEPRVEKLKSLVQGEWDNSKCLVTISKPGKFWAQMGFTDNRRNWLFPEEALFLMEANALEVYDGNIPLSIQEAYTKFLGSDVSIEEYQVFSYLRRLGFVVQRHDEHPSVTPYERKINLDKYLKKRHRAEIKCKTRLKDKQLKTSEAESNSRDRLSLITIVDLNTSETSLDNTTNGKSACSKSNDEKNSPSALSNTDDINILNNRNGQSPQPLEKTCTSHSPVRESHVPDDKNDSSAQVFCPVEVTGTTGTLQANRGDKLETDCDMLSHHSAPPQLSLNNTTTEPSGVEKRNISQVDSVEVDSSSKKTRCSATEVSDSKDLSENSIKDSCSQDLSADSAKTTCRKFYHDTWADCHLKLISQNTEQRLKKYSTDLIEPCKINCSQIATTEDVIKLDDNLSNSLVTFPDIANAEIVKLVCPAQKFIPPNIEMSADDESLIFDVSQYKIKNQKKSKKRQKEEEKDRCVKSLQFSFPKWIPGHSESSQGSSKTTFTNWSTYKKKLAEVAQDLKSNGPVAHYWEGDVTPLVHPRDATSYEAILNRLSIIPTAENETLTPDSDCMISIKISYDVHLPDSRFKKSMPGVPHHRVCVTKSSTEPPGLRSFQEL